MSVDGIGSGGGRPVRGPAEGEAVRAPAEVAVASVGDAGPAEAAGGAVGATPLSALERGQIDLDHYLDIRVAEATRHLEGRLPLEELHFVRGALREQLATDPVLVELVRRTTGALPAPRTE